MVENISYLHILKEIVNPDTCMMEKVYGMEV